MSDLSPAGHFERGVGASAAIDHAAWIILQPGLTGQPSPLLPGVVTWTVANARRLPTLIDGDNADMGDRSFLEKLRDQLLGKGDEIIVFAAELLYLHVLPLVNLKAESKVRRIDEVLSWTASGVTLTPSLRQGLEAEGIFSGGAGFNIRIWKQVLWLCRFVEMWCEASSDAREGALRDPWVFRDLAMTTPGQDETAMRISLQSMVWPAFFDNVVASDSRRRIRDAFGHLIGVEPKSDGDVDKQLFELRRTIQAPGEERFEWYLEPYNAQWSGGHSQKKGRRAWLVRPGQGGAELVERWRDDDFVSLPARNLELELEGASEAAIRSAVDQGYGHFDYAQKLQMTQEDESFILRMGVEDLVVGLIDDVAILGVVSGKPAWGSADDSRLRRAVDWLPGSVPRLDLPEPLPGLLDKQGNVVDLTTAMDVLEQLEIQLIPLDDPLVVDVPPVVRSRSVTPTLPVATDDLASGLHMSRESLDEYLELLQDRQQVVFYGPPGTGKTFIAEALGQHIVGNATNHMVTVQFHPSYAYEDFFEGLRPVASDSGVMFDLVPGPLRRLVADATSEEGQGYPFVLVIDEMNRANLAKVFGELYYLLEYRNQSITLQYSPEHFSLPKNLFIIGTMNTLDRSISMVDAAIRRRFPFVELHPSVEPVSGVLSNYLTAQGADDTRAKLLAALNSGISERDLQIGPSYLMKSGAASRKGLERIWKYDILPLLEDHFYGTRSPEEVRRQFGLDALLAEIEGASATTSIGTVDFVSDTALSVDVDVVQSVAEVASADD